MLWQIAEASWFNDLVASQKIEENTKTALFPTATGERPIEIWLEKAYKGNMGTPARKKEMKNKQNNPKPPSYRHIP